MADALLFEQFEFPFESSSKRVDAGTGSKYDVIVFPSGSDRRRRLRQGPRGRAGRRTRVRGRAGEQRLRPRTSRGDHRWSASNTGAELARANQFV